jgi:hypothetical protein
MTDPLDTANRAISTVREHTPSVQTALKVLAWMERELGAAETYTAIKKIVDGAEALKILHREVDEVRQRCEWVVLVAGRRISDEIEKVPKASGGDQKSKLPKRVSSKSGRAATGIPGTSRSHLKKSPNSANAWPLQGRIDIVAFWASSRDRVGRF